jgi:hypothetical protein
MSEHTLNRVCAACGITSVVLLLVGSLAGSAGGQPSYTLSSSTAHIARELAKPVGPLGWVGAYVELLSFGCFLAFLVWACARLGGGLLGAIGRAAGLGYATLSVTALGVMDALAYRAGHGIGAQLGTALANVSSALFVASWLLAAFFLLAAAPLALASGRRALGWSAIGIALLTLVLTPALRENGGQAAYFLWLGWIVYASVSLGRRAPAREAEAAAVATSRGYVPSA